MSENYFIKNTDTRDLSFIYQLFDDAIIYQKKKGYPVWPDYDKEVLKEDINQNNQYKIIIDDTIACIFSICFSDPVVWRLKDTGDAIYLHRIVVNPYFKGQRQFEKILRWSLSYASANNIDHIRMDTWANNPTLIKYYNGYDFEVVEYFTNPNTTELPIQQRGNRVVLLQFNNSRRNKYVQKH